jgi:hypothetical protein
MRSRAAMVLVVAGLLAGMPGVQSPAAAATIPGVSAFTFLTGSIALSPSDAWAVGWDGVAGTTVLSSVSEHWNGRKWASVHMPDLNVGGLQGVSAAGPSDIWGVGFVGAGPLIEHYNGRKWAVASFSYEGGAGQLNGVDMRTSSDAWAVGWVNPGSHQDALAERWNGRRWAQVTTAPISGSFVQLNSVLDLGQNNVLAVGDYQVGSGGTSVRHELPEHWNGRTWRPVSGPAISAATVLMGVSGGKRAGVTAVGYESSGGHDVPLIERWNGTRLVRVTQPASAGDLNAVTVLSRTSAYAVGDNGRGSTLLEHYNGQHWTRVATPDPADGGYFSGVATTPSGSFAVAAGSHGPDLAERPLLEQGNGRTWPIALQ